MTEIATVCPYCGCGCGLYLQVRDGLVVGVSPSRAHPVSQGRLCVKGWHAHELVGNPRRLTRPLVRRGKALEEASWEEAISAAAAGLAKVRAEDGPKAIGVLGSARCTNEDNYVLVRFARGTLGTPNIDCSLRIQCVPEAPEAGGVLGISTGQIGDIDECDVVLVVGSDPTEEHPAVGGHIYRARERGAKVVVASTRRHALARLADVYLPVRAGAESSWVASLLHVLLIERGMVGEATPELAALRASVADRRPEEWEAETGVPAAALRAAAEYYMGSRRAVLVYSAGLTLSGEAGPAVRALGNLAALSAMRGSPELSVLSLLSRNNLQGCRDMGVAPDVLPGYARLSDDGAVERLEGAWQCELARQVGMSAWEMLGRVRAMYVMGDDVIRCMPDAGAARAELEALDFLVVHDLFLSPVASLADVVLPAAAFAERDGTWTSLERRVQRIRRAVGPAGEAREDWRIVADISAALGKPMPYRDVREVFEEITDLLPIYTGVFYPPLDVNGGIRWPTPEAREVGRTFVAPEEKGAGPPSAGEVTAERGRAEASEEYPLVLAADPTLRPWDEEVVISHTLTAAGEFTVMAKDYRGGMLCLSPEDAKRLGVRGGRPVRVVSARGETQMQVRVTEETREGIALVPYQDGARSEIMEIAADPVSGRPVLAPTPISVGPVQ